MERLLNWISNKTNDIYQPLKWRRPNQRISALFLKFSVVALNRKNLLKEVSNKLSRVLPRTINIKSIQFLNVIMLHTMWPIVSIWKIWRGLVCCVGVSIGYQVENSFWKSFIIVGIRQSIFIKMKTLKQKKNMKQMIIHNNLFTLKTITSATTTISMILHKSSTRR